MGNTRSKYSDDDSCDPFWNLKADSTVVKREESCDVRNVNLSDTEERSVLTNDDKLDKFRQELARKREKRRQLIEEKRKEMQSLRDEVAKQKKENEELRSLFMEGNSDLAQKFLQLENERLREELTELQEKLILKDAGAVTDINLDNQRMKEELVNLRDKLSQYESVVAKNTKLQTHIAELQKDLQCVNAEIASFEKERLDYQLHVTALKDVVKVSKQMLQIRENQIKELRQKVGEIEASLAGREASILSEDLRQEYERQLRNIRNLRALYEERQRADKREKEELTSQLESAKKDLEDEQTKTKELQNRISELETENSKKYDTINSLQSNLGLVRAECRELESEMNVINQLFSHILLGFNNCQEIDFDKLIKLLEENHDLLQNIVINDDSNTSSALPKVLLDLVSQISVEKSEENVDEETASSKRREEKLETIEEEPDTPTSSYNLNSAEQIVENLPKVWKVLIELLSHQNPPVNVLTEEKLQDSDNPCYKVVQTPTGPKLVLSVSQTFIRLKNLILEKKSLEKETSNLKQLNTHLEIRLQDQEKRLELVSNELSKTWHVVGKMQKQHQQLYTQEKILRYELAQKRKMLTELKEELEYCREKWLQAREKNSSTEAQWKELRTEFASRKSALNDDLNNSVESGYSDEQGCSTDEEEPGYETDISECNAKALSPETVSEDNLNTDSISEALNDGIESEESDIVQVIRNEIVDIETSTPIHNTDEPGSGDDNSPASLRRNSEEFAIARDRRLRRLEEEAQQLMARVTKTTDKSVEICTKLDNLHEMYGESSGTSQNQENTQHENIQTEHRHSDDEDED